MLFFFGGSNGKNFKLRKKGQYKNYLLFACLGNNRNFKTDPFITLTQRQLLFSKTFPYQM